MAGAFDGRIGFGIEKRVWICYQQCEIRRMWKYKKSTQLAKNKFQRKGASDKKNDLLFAIVAQVRKTLLGSHNSHCARSKLKSKCFHHGVRKFTAK